ncbi:MAG: B12-binding domain-containing protein [Planctomycetota bacterium]
MCTDALRQRFFDVLVTGDRAGARAVVDKAMETGESAADLITELYWPTYERIEKLFRGDQLSKLCHHYATRLLRVLADQTAGLIIPQASNGRSVLVFCGPRDSDDLAGQLAVDLLIGRGFEVRYGGGGVPNDEVIAEVKETQPSILLMFASGSNDLPHIRQLIDTLHEMGACPDLQIAVGGGVFNRAAGLADEIGADISGVDPLDVVELLIEEPTRRSGKERKARGPRSGQAVRAA